MSKLATLFTRFRYYITVPKGLRDICPLTITIPDGETSIGERAFTGNRWLTSITIPDSVTSIGNSAFRGCSKLTSITIPDSVTSIDAWAFWDCSHLTSITIPDSVTSIDSLAFVGCSKLTSIQYNGTQAQWNSVENGCRWNYSASTITVYFKDGTSTTLAD